MNQAKISVSMMCAGLTEIERAVRIFEAEKVEYLHIDVMDGEFVPNYALGSDYIRMLRDMTDIPLDMHLMITRPEYKYRWLGIQAGDLVSVHYESTAQVRRAIDWLNELGCRTMLALNPATPVYAVEESLDAVCGILAMTVNPGYAGQRIVPSTIDKVRKIREFLDERGKTDLELEVDGNITFENAKKLRQVGATMFVAGSSSVFHGPIEQYPENVRQLRRAIE